MPKNRARDAKNKCHFLCRVAVAARLGLSATVSGRRGRFWVAAITWALGLAWDWLERDPDSRKFSQAFMLLRRSGTNVAFAGAKIYRRYPSEIQLASALKSVTVVAIWLPEKNGLSEGSDKPLILRYVWFRELNLNQQPSGYELYGRVWYSMSRIFFGIVCFTADNASQSTAIYGRERWKRARSAWPWPTA